MPHRRLWVGLAVASAVAVAVMELVALFLTPGLNTVVIYNASFEETTPPTTFCPFWFTIGGPPPVFTVPSGSLFNLSWQIGCEPYGPGNTTGATFVVRSVVSSTWGFSVSSSDLPVVFGYDVTSYFNVSVRAPDWPWVGSLTLTITGGPSPVP
jgi:hypothetical protein